MHRVSAVSQRSRIRRKQRADARRREELSERNDDSDDEKNERPQCDAARWFEERRQRWLLISSDLVEN